MRIKLLSLLIVGAINSIATQQVIAEQANNGSNNLDSPIWPAEQMPIAWGECIPVPVMPSPQPMLYPMNPRPPAGFMPSMPFPNNQGGQTMMMPNGPSMLMPPPSPFFNPAELPIPLPSPTIGMSSNQISCDNADTVQLKKLQSHYALASSASKVKINELNQALEDIQNQMSDSRSIIETLEAKISKQSSENDAGELEKTKFNVLQATYKQQNDEKNILKKKLTELDATKTQLTEELNRIKVNAKTQATELLALSQSTSELKALQTAHQHQNITNYELNKKIAETEAIKKDLQAQIIKLNGDVAAYSEKLGALKEIATKYKVLQESYQIRNSEIIELNSMLTEADTTQGSLQKLLSGFEKNASTQAQKLTSLGQTATEFKTLKQEYQTQTKAFSGLKQKLSSTNTKLSILQEQYQQQNKEVVALETLLAKTKDSKKTIQTKLSELEENSGIQTQKLSALGQAVTEFKVLQEAYQVQNNEVTGLQKKLAETDTKLGILQEQYQKRNKEVVVLEKLLAKMKNSKKSLQVKLSELEENSGIQTQKLSALGQTATEFKVLQEAYQKQNKEVVELEQLLTKTKGSKNTLQIKLSELVENSGVQTQKLSALEQTATEFNVLQEAYQVQNNEVTSLQKKLAETDAKLKILQEAYGKRNEEVTELEKLLANSDEKKKSLRVKLSELEESAGVQTQKLSAFGQIETEYKVLQDTYQSQNYSFSELKTKLVEIDAKKKALQGKLSNLKKERDEQRIELAELQKSTVELTRLQDKHQLLNTKNIELKKKLAGIEENNDTLISKLKGLESKTASQAEKLIALGKSTTELDELQKVYEERLSEITTLKSKTSAMDDEYKSLQAKLASVESNSTEQAEKLVALGKSTTELGELQKAHEERLSEITTLKSKIAAMDDEYKSLQAKLTSVETNSTEQARKLTALGQVSTEFTALQSAYKERSNNNANIKAKLAKMDIAYKELQTKLSSFENKASTQSKELIRLGKTEKDLGALQIAYKGSIDDNTTIQNQLTETDSAYKTLKAKLGTLESTSAGQLRKLNSLKKSASELSALQGVYKERNNENVTLKKQLAKRANDYKALQGKLVSLESNTANQAEKLAALGRSTTELSELQKAYKAKLSEIEALKQQLAKMGNTYKTLQGKLTGIESNAADQVKQLTASGSKSATELMSLQGAYDTRNNENAELKKKLGEQEKILIAKIENIKKISSGQAQEITTLTATASELDVLKSKYKDLEDKLIAVTADTDNDSILDLKDKCPNTPAGTEVNIWGCFADSDSDGVANSTDQCPTSPEGSIVNNIGCPAMKDADKDGIADKKDLCPATKAGETVNNFGCIPTENITLKGVNFATGSATLTSNSLPVLDRAAKTLINNPTIKSVQVLGHTDNKGIAAINKRLSQRRANSVMIYLIKKGVNANRLTAKGYGESQPTATNDSESGRATNRRVELKIK